MKLALNVPINRVSFGQVSTLLLKTLFEQETKESKVHDIYLFPIGQVELSSQKNDPLFNEWVKGKIVNGLENYDRDIPIFKLWHLNGSLDSYSRKQTLLSFYELDEPTKIELNVAKNNKTYFSSKYSCEVFANAGVETSYMPLAFDSFNFSVLNKKFFNDERTVFNVCGKFEKRKNHVKVIQSWIKKYGGNPKYTLNCAIYNGFLNPQQNEQVINFIVQGQKPFNVNFFPAMEENQIYNDFLNSGDIVLGLSGAEGFGLPEFQSIALGKHAVLLNAHVYKDWCSQNMATWVNPSQKVPAYDGVFFHQGQPYNQGNIFDFNEEEFLVACDTAVNKVQASKKNTNGLKLQEQYSKEKFVDSVINSL